VPLLVGQGCIAGPKHNWVGIYWLAPTLLYTASVSFPRWYSSTYPYQISVQFGLALMRSINSLKSKHLSPWKLMLRDGLNLYGVRVSPRIIISFLTLFFYQAIWLVNMINMLFWFIMKPTGIDDPVKTIVTRYVQFLPTKSSPHDPNQPPYQHGSSPYNLNVPPHHPLRPRQPRARRLLRPLRLLTHRLLSHNPHTRHLHALRRHHPY
jgi:hypothetical protein